MFYSVDRANLETVWSVFLGTAYPDLFEKQFM
jgi:hypothetical protein